ncbi:MAG: hypothetical protein L6R41_007721 [Letrouitia leprolyta]|nr:MAG: hypothetical protein L6R41_007721 [Letrouitia leprolyta]
MEKGNGNEDYQDEKDKEKTYRKGIQKMSLPASHFSLLTSTLVLEHIPLLPRFLHTCSSLLRVGGFLLITNMHEDMGKAGSQAGFTNPDTGEKVRGDSYFHRVEDVVEEAGRCGLEVHWGPEEREVMPAQVGMLGRRAERWVGVRVWWGVVLRKKVNS